MLKNIELIGEKIRLVPITKEYTDLIIRWRNTDSVRKNFIFQEDFTTQIHNAWIDNKVNAGEVVQFIIIDKNGNIPVGSVYLRDIDHKNDKAEYGIFIGVDSARGKGLGTEAARLICNFGFDQLKLHKIMLRVFANNENAICSYEKAGFMKEALLKDEYKINDKYRDIILMAIIRK